MWDNRYASAEYIYGTNPNSYLVEMTHRIPKGRVLCLAEGEGRNAVYLATQGYEVTGVDSSRVGLEKAQKLAAERSVKITTVHADLAEFPIEPDSWDGIVSIFCHLPSAVRAEVYRKAIGGLRRGGVFVLEAYTPRQLNFATGGPSNVDSLVEPDTLKTELAGLQLAHFVETERDVTEGQGHRGRGAVVQVLGLKGD